MTRPALASSRTELQTLLTDARTHGRPVGLVPTMGALHEGHASLMRTARAEVTDGPLVVSVFVNPMQFGAGEDLDRYPRTLAADLDMCRREGADVVFAPSVAEVYPGSTRELATPQITVDPGPLGEVLEGRTRPGHFRGVLTVVAKLFGLVRPDVAVFGQKDYQQLVLIRRMVEDLCLGVRVVGAETVREEDGLALSSRNRYLDPAERRTALALSRALRAVAEAAGHEDVTAAAAAAAGRAVLAAEHGLELDYLALTDPALGELAATPTAGTQARALVAARVGSTRLIDNLPVVFGASTRGAP